MKAIFRVLTVFILLGVIALCASKAAPDLSDAVSSHIKKERIASIVKDSSGDAPFTHEAYKKLYSINPNLVGYLLFDSGIVSEPIVQGSTNETYLRLSFDGVYSSQGTIFMDSDASINSQHFTIFGHNVYYDDSAMFSPISKLVEQREYENNKTFVIYTSDLIHRYVITNVMYLTDDDSLNYDYTRTSFHSEDEFESWIAFANSRNLILCDEAIGFRDRFVTLQTCKRWDEHTIILILAKEIGHVSY